MDRPAGVDDYGAPEFFCDDMLLEMVGPGIVRALMVAHEAGGTIVKCKLLLPISVLSHNILRTQVFMASNLASVN